MFFFFSSRRRHTRCLSDWSSDVCSSDLHRAETRATPRGRPNHDLPAASEHRRQMNHPAEWARHLWKPRSRRIDRKSTRLNSSHLGISYAVFCLKKKKKIQKK